MIENRYAELERLRAGAKLAKQIEVSCAHTTARSQEKQREAAREYDRWRDEYELEAARVLKA